MSTFLGDRPDRPEAVENAPAEPRWKRVVRGVFIVILFLVWLDGLPAFHCFGVAFRAAGLFNPRRLTPSP